MKYSVPVIAVMVLLFFVAQVVGLGIIDQYIDHTTTAATGNVTYESLPYNVTRPDVEEQTSFVYIMAGVLIGTGLLLLLIKYGLGWVWKTWYFGAVLIGLVLGFGAFLPELIAGILGLTGAALKLWWKHPLIHNITEVFLYGGIAALFVPILNLFSVVILLVLISVYDAYAVWKSKHMVTLAEFQSKSQLFAGLSVPTDMKHHTKKSPKGKGKRVGAAILGGGDIAFPLLFAGVVMKDLMLQHSHMTGFLLTLIIPTVAAVSLGLLLYLGKKDHYYPAMPFLSVAVGIGYGIVLLLM